MKTNYTIKNVNYTKLNCIVIFTATILIYFPIMYNGFLDFWDDQWVIMNHYTENGVNSNNIYNIMTDFYNGQFAPFNELLYLFLFQISGYNPFYFHSASIILHFLNSILVYFIIQNITFSLGKFSLKEIRYLSLLTSLIFAIHPFNVESVAWGSASKVLVYSFFYFSAIYSFITYLENKKNKYYIFTIILYICSFLGKEQAVTLPICLLLLAYLKGYSIANKSLWVDLIPFFILTLCFGITTIISQQVNGEGVLVNDSYSIGQRLIFATYSYIEYLSKSIFPIKLLYIYPFPIQPGDPLPMWLLIYPFTILTICITLWEFIKERPFLFGILFFTIHLLTVLHFIPMSRYSIIADRYAYISTIGVCFILSYIILLLYKHHVRLRNILYILSVSYLVTLGFYAHKRTYVWNNTDSLKKELRDLLYQRNKLLNKTSYYSCKIKTQQQ